MSEASSIRAPPIYTHERETAAEVHQRQARGVSTVRGYRLLRDVKSLAKRLILVQPQLRSDLSRAQLKTNLPCAFVYVGKRRFRLYAEVRGRNQDELHVCFHRSISKRGPTKDFVCGIANFNSRCLQRRLRFVRPKCP